jgi:hypothetical protein
MIELHEQGKISTLFFGHSVFFSQFDPLSLNFFGIGLYKVCSLPSYGDPIILRKKIQYLIDTWFCKIDFNYIDLKLLGLKWPNVKLKTIIKTKVNGQWQID